MIEFAFFLSVSVLTHASFNFISLFSSIYLCYFELLQASFTNTHTHTHLHKITHSLSLTHALTHIKAHPRTHSHTLLPTRHERATRPTFILTLFMVSVGETKSRKRMLSFSSLRFNAFSVALPTFSSKRKKRFYDFQRKLFYNRVHQNTEMCNFVS